MAKSKPLVSEKQLRQFIRNAFDSYCQHQIQVRQKFGDLRISNAYGYPQLPGAAEIDSQILERVTPDKVVEHLEWRLRKISYPYPPPYDRKSFKSFHKHLEERRILQLVLTSPIREDIGQTWLDQWSFDAQKKVHDQLQSRRPYEVAFHKDALHEIARHLQALCDITEKYNAAGTWFANYRAEIQKALLREAKLYYPQMPESFTAATDFFFQAHKISAQVILFEGVRDNFIFNKIKQTEKLAYHLTALVCSPIEAIKQGRLDPKPATVSRNIRDYRKKASTRRKG